jgi:hypothetical protein
MVTGQAMHLLQTWCATIHSLHPTHECTLTIHIPDTLSDSIQPTRAIRTAHIIL